eukprot:GHVT01104272.1.p2 GENE.GHVT01104272.1~~GHVT01104272.1.p2  ORF type:complete len:108 (+),score=9.39 GHVT01104272.1:111-434(+)
MMEKKKKAKEEEAIDRKKAVAVQKEKHKQTRKKSTIKIFFLLGPLYVLVLVFAPLPQSRVGHTDQRVVAKGVRVVEEGEYRRLFDSCVLRIIEQRKYFWKRDCFKKI